MESARRGSAAACLARGRREVFRSVPDRKNGPRHWLIPRPKTAAVRLAGHAAAAERAGHVYSRAERLALRDTLVSLMGTQSQQVKPRQDKLSDPIR